jgi:hypothetical protein
MGQTHTGLDAQSKAEGDEALGEPQGAATVGSRSVKMRRGQA